MEKIPMLYKVLVDGKSCHGGSHEWKVGVEYTYNGDLKMCERGFHLTTKPYDKWFKIGCDVYVAKTPKVEEWRDDKALVRRVKLIRKLKRPAFQTRVEDFVDKDIKKVRFFKPDGKPKKEWKIFYGDTWGAARDAAWGAARGAARGAALGAAWDAALGAEWGAALGAARDAAWGAELKALFYVVDDLRFKDKKKHLTHVNARWEVWTKGYALYCDVNGVLYVYAKKAKA